jgi:ubiquinone biosynthesis protein
MWAAIRLIRAMRVFAVIFLSYMWAVAWARLWPKRCDTSAKWKKTHRRNARRMYKGFVRLRGVYIKLGQILSVMGTFLPREIVAELETLQDDVPSAPYKKICKTFIGAFGKTPDKVFKTFSREPIAAASLGQVHEARNEAGDKLAVKILYPRVATIIKVDLKVLGWAIKVYKNFVPIKQIERVHEQLGDMLERETDLVNEAAMIVRMSKNFEGDPDVLFPKVYSEWSTRTVMTMSFMDGVKISKKDALNTLGLDPYAVATKLIKVFYKQLFIDRFFHADPHPGNFFVQRAEILELLRSHQGVAGDFPLVRKSRLLALPRLDDALADLRGGFARPVAGNFPELHRRHFHVQINPIQQRPGNPAQIILNFARRASRLMRHLAVRRRVHRGDQHELGGEGHRARGA